MGIIFILVFLNVLAMVCALVWIYFGPFIAAHWPLLIAPIGVLYLVVTIKSLFSNSPASITDPSKEEKPTKWTETRNDATGVEWVLTQLCEKQPAPFQGHQSEVEQLKQRLWKEIQARFQVEAQLLDGPAAARISGRIARLSPGLVWLAVLDEGKLYQAIRIKASQDHVDGLEEGMKVEVTCVWRRGRLTLDEVESAENSDEPMPEVKLPEVDTPSANAADGKLPSLSELEKESRRIGWGSLNHSIYRFNIPIHITVSPKCRSKVFEGRAVEVQAILREVAEKEGLKVIAIAAETDHVHMLGIPDTKGGQPPTWCWSSWVGRWKALSSKRLKSLPGLESFAWQVGYALTAVSGGRQGAEEALAVVESYVRNQGVQSDENDRNTRGEGFSMALSSR